MLTENIAQDAVLLISQHMQSIVNDPKEVLRKSKDEQFQCAGNLWGCIKTKFQVTEVARNIVLDLEATPHCEIVQAILRHQLSKYFKRDDDFAWEMEQILFNRNFKTSTRTPVRKAVFTRQIRKARDFVQTGNLEAKSMPLVHPTNIDTQDVQHNGN